MSFLQVKNLRCRAGSFVLDDISFEIDRGEFLSVVGSSGSGKTMLLESIAGFHRVEGSIRLNGREITHLPPEKRGVGMVYQDYMLFPNMNVEKNILYSTRFKKSPLNKGFFDEIVDFLKIRSILSRSVTSLSGGEKQRVAIARALMSEPEIMLLDEPLNAVDFSFRVAFMEFLKDLHRRYGLTVIYVTHNFKEALFLSDRMMVLLDGKLRQFGSTEEVFNRPVSRDVALFLGFKNILPVSLLGDGASGYFSVSPESVSISKKPARDGDYMFEARVEDVLDMKKRLSIRVAVGDEMVVVYGNTGFTPGDRVYISFNKKDVIFFGE